MYQKYKVSWEPAKALGRFKLIFTANKNKDSQFMSKFLNILVGPMEKEKAAVAFSFGTR
jgi:hypothetical protein